MTQRVHYPGHLIFSVGTQVVTLRNIVAKDGSLLHPRGAVGIVVRSPEDLEHSYRVRFPDGLQEALRRDEVVMLARYQEGGISEPLSTNRSPLYDSVIYRCIIGSRAYGLDDTQSDIDYRGVFLPPAELHWSLYGVPDQLECHDTQEHYWELQRFLVLALKANPNVLECLYSPLVEKAIPLAEELLAMRESFLSRVVYQTYNGYVMSQFKKMQADLRNQGQVKWKHVMHLIRVLMSGISALRHAVITVRVDEHRDQLLAIKKGEVSWDETEKWRLSLHAELDKAFSQTKLPERPDYERANTFLLKARRFALMEQFP